MSNNIIEGYLKKTKSLSATTETVLRLFGLNNSYKGYSFLIYGIELVIEKPDILTCICKGLYIEIALHFNTTVYCVERNIRTAKEIIWQNGDKMLLKEVFGDAYKESPPGNAAFIDMLAYYIGNEMS